MEAKGEVKVMSGAAGKAGTSGPDGGTVWGGLLFTLSRLCESDGLSRWVSPCPSPGTPLTNNFFGGESTSMSPFLFNGPKALGRIATLGLTHLLLPNRRVGLGEEFGVTPPLGMRIGWDEEKYCLPIRVGEGARGKISSLCRLNTRSSCSAVTI